jgi:hypothetical protein
VIVLKYVRSYRRYILCLLLTLVGTMTNLDDNLALLSPCMFANGNSSVDIRHSPESPAACNWCRDGNTNSYNKTIVTWSSHLPQTNEPLPIHTSTMEPYPWKSSNFHERESVSDNVITSCCGERISKGSEEMNVTCWKSDLLLDDGDTTDQSVEGSSSWCEGLSTPLGNSRSTSPKSRGTSRAKKTKVSTGTYKHVPHRDKPPQIVARRNARERRRVQAVNSAFSRLRKVVPIDNNRYVSRNILQSYLYNERWWLVGWLVS